jgi:hypothetical protein
MSLPRLFIVSQTNPLPPPSSPAPPPLCQRIKVFHHIWQIFSLFVTFLMLYRENATTCFSL